MQYAAACSANKQVHIYPTSINLDPEITTIWLAWRKAPWTIGGRFQLEFCGTTPL